MIGGPRIGIKALAGMSRRVAMSLEAGVDVRAVFAREADRARSTAAAARLRAISQAVAAGESVHEAFVRTGKFFPPLVRELVEVGEKTGHLGEVFAQLAEHYDGRLHLRRQFLAGITWPMIQLVAAVLIIGMLIWIMGLIERSTGTRVDPLGLGLIGNPGLLVYSAVIGAIAAAVAALIWAARRGYFWVRPVERFVLRIPVLGRSLHTLALARVAWAMHLTLKAGMDVRRAVELSLRSAGNVRCRDSIPAIEAGLSSGDNLYEAFASSRAYPPEFLDALAVGEQTGRSVEAMETLSRQYAERARAALAVLNTLAGFAVWMLVAAVIIAAIFRLAFFYLGTINQMLEM